MASSSSSGTAGGGRALLTGEGAAAMAECIGFLFGQWAALQMAVRNRWGGRDSQAKADQIAASVLSWFTNAAKGAGPLDQDELEDLMCDAMDEFFHADLDDGSTEEAFGTPLFGKMTAAVVGIGDVYLVFQTLAKIKLGGGLSSRLPYQPDRPAVSKHLMITYTRCLRKNYSYLNKLRKTRLAGSAITQSKKIMQYGGNESSDDDDEEEVIPMEVEAPRNQRPAKPVPDADGWTTIPTRHRRK